VNTSNIRFKHLSVLLLLPLFVGPKASAVVGTGTARQVVLQALAIAPVSDLVFPPASPSAVAAVVPPGTVESAANGSFTVTGAANTAYTITLPTTINLVNGANTIAVSAFTSFPAAGANGLLSAGGTQLLLIGATRAALTAAQATGTYTGTYVVNVVY
jgi:hypothetical protein